MRPIKPANLDGPQLLQIGSNRTVHLTLDGVRPLCNTIHVHGTTRVMSKVGKPPATVTCSPCLQRGRYVENALHRLLTGKDERG